MMKRLSMTESIIMLAGAILMIAGVALLFFEFTTISPWIFLAGAILFSAMQLRQEYAGTNFTIRRLRRIMIAGDIAFILAGLMFVESQFNFLLPAFLKIWPQDGYITYLHYIHNNWVVLLLVAAILELYSTHRIAHELKKDTKNL